MTWVAFSVFIITLLFILLASGVWIAIALMTTGMSPPPMGTTKATPSTNESTTAM